MQNLYVVYKGNATGVYMNKYEEIVNPKMQGFFHARPKAVQFAQSIGKVAGNTIVLLQSLNFKDGRLYVTSFGSGDNQMTEAEWNASPFPGGEVEWNDILNKPDKFPPEAHRHPTSEIDNFDVYIKAAIDYHNMDELNNAHPAIRKMVDDLEFIVDGDINTDTGLVRFFRRNGSVLSFNMYEGAFTDLKYDPDTKELVFIKHDGTEVRIPVADFFEDYKGSAGEQVDIVIDSGNIIRAILKNGTVTRSKLEQAIIDSLNKADSALQSFTETDPIYLANKPFIALKTDIPDITGLVTKEEFTATAMQFNNAINELWEHCRRLERLGSWAGTFDNLATPQQPGNTIVPTNFSDISDLTINDYVHVRFDETQNGASTRYVIDQIIPGSPLSWKLDLIFSSDATDKADKVAGNVNNHLAALDQTGNLKSSGKLVSDLIDRPEVETIVEDAMDEHNKDETAHPNKAPKKHDSTLPEYGEAGNGVFGHVRYHPNLTASNQLNNAMPYHHHGSGSESSRIYNLNVDYSRAGFYALYNPHWESNGFPPDWPWSNEGTCILLVVPMYSTAYTYQRIVRRNGETWWRISSSQTVWSVWTREASFVPDAGNPAANHKYAIPATYITEATTVNLNELGHSSKTLVYNNPFGMSGAPEDWGAMEGTQNAFVIEIIQAGNNRSLQRITKAATGRTWTRTQAGTSTNPTFTSWKETAFLAPATLPFDLNRVMMALPFSPLVDLDDFNEITRLGVYSIPNVHDDAINAPPVMGESGGELRVFNIGIGGTGNIAQEFTCINGEGTYFRRRQNNAWGGWRKTLPLFDRLQDSLPLYGGQYGYFRERAAMFSWHDNAMTFLETDLNNFINTGTFVIQRVHEFSKNFPNDYGIIQAMNNGCIIEVTEFIGTGGSLLQTLKKQNEFSTWWRFRLGTNWQAWKKIEGGTENDPTVINLPDYIQQTAKEPSDYTQQNKITFERFARAAMQIDDSENNIAEFIVTTYKTGEHHPIKQEAIPNPYTFNTLRPADEWGRFRYYRFEIDGNRWTPWISESDSMRLTTALGGNRMTKRWVDGRSFYCLVVEVFSPSTPNVWTQMNSSLYDMDFGFVTGHIELQQDGAPAVDLFQINTIDGETGVGIQCHVTRNANGNHGAIRMKINADIPHHLKFINRPMKLIIEYVKKVGA